MRNRIITVVGFWLYIFFLGGLLFNTSQSSPVIFGKYSWSQFVLIIIALIFALPYFFLIRYLAKSTTYNVGKRTLKLSPGRKILIVVITLLIGLILGDQIMRMDGIRPERPVYSMDFHPFLQQKVRKNLNESDYHTNSYGFRGDEIAKEKPKGTYRIVILGGSTAYGIPVNYTQSTPKLLEDQLRKHYKTKIEVINAGVPWYTSEHSIIDYMFRISDFQPDLIIMWQGVNDMYAGCPDASSPTIPFESDYSHILGPLGKMVNTYFNPPPISIHLLTLDYLSKFAYWHLYTDLEPYKDTFITTSRKRLSPHIPAEDVSFPSITSYERNLRYLINVTRDDNVKLVLANQPNMFSTLEKYNKNNLEWVCYDGKRQANLNSQIKGIEEFNKATKNVAKVNDVPFIDIDSLLPRTPDYFVDAFHWNVKGHIVVSKHLYNFIVDNGFIPE